MQLSAHDISSHWSIVRAVPTTLVVAPRVVEFVIVSLFVLKSKFQHFVSVFSADSPPGHRDRFEHTASFAACTYIAKRMANIR